MYRDVPSKGITPMKTMSMFHHVIVSQFTTKEKIDAESTTTTAAAAAVVVGVDEFAVKRDEFVFCILYARSLLPTSYCFSYVCIHIRPKFQKQMFCPSAHTPQRFIFILFLRFVGHESLIYQDRPRKYSFVRETSSSSRIPAYVDRNDENQHAEYSQLVIL
jgi:hypothetical protein